MGHLEVNSVQTPWTPTRPPGAKCPLHGCIGREFDDEEESGENEHFMHGRMQHGNLENKSTFVAAVKWE